jgi:hypothetical protein
MCMPVTTLDALPDHSRIWIFVADQPVTDATVLLAAVDAHLAEWKAHGRPLLCAREWRDDRVLIVAVDEAASGASGCSIDGLFRTIARVQSQVGADVLGSGRIAWRDGDGVVQVATRAVFEQRARAGAIGTDTRVLQTLTENLGEWRHAGEVSLAESWAAALV